MNITKTHFENHVYNYKKNIHTNPKHHMTKWATFTYGGNEGRTIELSKNTHKRSFFHTKHNKTLNYHTQTDNYNNSGIYQTKCLVCPLKYISQTGRIFNSGYKEHIHAIRNKTAIPDIQRMY
jgi:hypothetical protein